MLSALRNFALTFAISALIFGLIAYFVSGFVLSTMSDIGSGTGNDETLDLDISTATADTDETEVPPEDEPIEVSGNSFNVLFIGSDYQELFEDQYDPNKLDYKNPLGVFYTRKPQIDTLLLMRVDKEDRKFVFCSIPTNIRIIKDSKYVELRELYANGNELELSRYVTAYTGIEIDYYIHLNIDQFISFVDAFGSFSYTCPYTMKYEDPEQELVIDLKKGDKINTAEKALALLRFDEYDSNSTNLTRESVAVDFMQSMFSSFTSKERSLTEYLTLYEKLIKHAVSNITADDVKQNLDLILAYSKFESVAVTYPGNTVRYNANANRNENSESTYYFEPDVSKAVELLG